MRNCPWCVYPYGHPATESAAPETLCRPHLAEYEGMSLAELDRMEREQHAEWREAVFG